MKNNKGFFISLIIILLISIFSCQKSEKQKEADYKNKVSEQAAKAAIDEKHRNVTVIVDLSETYTSEVILLTSYNKDITHRTQQKNHIIVLNDFDSKNAYKDIEDFKIRLIDRYGLYYEKEFKAEDKGNTDVIINNSCYVKHPGDWKRKATRFFNREW